MLGTVLSICFRKKESILITNFDEGKMTYLTSWEEFAKAAERLYLNDPQKCRFVTKYRHCDGKLNVKVTDDHVCLQYRTEHAQDVKKLEKLTNQLMRHMASKEKS